MSAPAMQFALHAKQREIEDLQLLADRITLIGVAGSLIHTLQRERGVSSIFLGSEGKRLSAARADVRAAFVPVLASLREHLDIQLEPARGASARMLSMMAWVLLDLEALDALRNRIDRRTVSARNAVLAFSKTIASLMELIFQLADISTDPAISRTLVALVHVAQSKEAAGQERAVAGLLFASGTLAVDQQQRLVHLIEAQERSLDVFAHFAGKAQIDWWQACAIRPHVATLERLRRIVCSARADARLDRALSETWFEVSSARISDLWELQQALSVSVTQTCVLRIDAAQQALRDSEALVTQWRAQPRTHTQALDHFFSADPQAGPESAMHLAPASLHGTAADSTVESLKTMLQAQSARLSQMEVELDAARRALQDRKLIERAKNALMSRHGLSEEAAFRLLQKTSMDQNRRIADMAAMVLAGTATPELSADARAQSSQP